MYKATRLIRIKNNFLKIKRGDCWYGGGILKGNSVFTRAGSLSLDTRQEGEGLGVIQDSGFTEMPFTIIILR